VIHDGVIIRHGKIIHYRRFIEELIHLVVRDVVMVEVVSQKMRRIDERKTIRSKAETEIESDKGVIEGEARS